MLIKVNYITLTRMGVELILGMEDVINYLNEVQAENKKLKEENKKLKEDLEKAWDQRGDKWRKARIKNLEAENKKLQEEIAHKNKKFGEWCEENKKLQGEVKKLREDLLKLAFNEESDSDEEEEKCAWEINVVGLGFCQYENEEERDKHVVYCKNDCWKVKGDKTAKDEEGNYCETDEEEELSKYEKEDSDWVRGYGFTTVNGEYRVVMAGGGDHWEDYVLTRDRNFIHNRMGESIVSTFISCPEGNYIKVVHIGEKYELEEGETDMYEMITECFQKEIMEYCDDEEPIEEPDSP